MTEHFNNFHYVFILTQESSFVKKVLQIFLVKENIFYNEYSPREKASLLAQCKAKLLSGLAAGMDIISFLSEHGV
jgi:hypothetical protein